MAESKKPGTTQYYLIPRDDQGDYITSAEQILRENGIPTYVQQVRPNTQTLTPDEQGVLRELQTLLPAQVHLPLDNPFLTLQITSPSAEISPAGEVCDCLCQCGSGGTCGGGGGGGCRPM
jgi:hypothetical protein